METIKNFDLFDRNNKEVSEISYPNKSFKEKYKGHIYKWEDYEGGFDSIQSFLHKITDDTLGKNWGKMLVKENKENSNFAYHVTSSKNMKSILSDGLEPRVPEDFGEKGDLKGVYLFKTYEDTENALYNWLGERIGDIEDETGEDYDEVILKINIDGLDLYDSVEYEWVCLEYISPERIKPFIQTIDGLKEWFPINEQFDFKDDDFDFEEDEHEHDYKYNDLFICTQNILDPTDFTLKFEKGHIYYFVDIMENGKAKLRDIIGNHETVSFSGLKNLFRKL